MSHSKVLAVALLLITNIQLLAQETADPSVELVATLRGHTKSILGIEFSHSGEIVATSSKDGTVRLWSTVTGESLKTITGDKNSEVSKMSWSSDDRWLAITSWGRKSWELAVWDVHGQSPRISQRIEATYLSEWSPNGHTFLTLDEKRNLKIWDVDSKQLTHTLIPGFSNKYAFTVSFVADGQKILTASVDGPVQLWDVATGKLVDTYPANTDPPGWAPNVSAVSLDKRFLISGNINIYETGTGRLLTSIAEGSNPISFSPDGKTVLTVSYDPDTKSHHRQSYLSIRKVDDGAELRTFQVPQGIYKVIWSPDGKMMAIVGLEFNTRVIDAATGRENGRLPYGNCWPWTMFGSDGCEPIKFSADGEMLLKEKEPIKLWDTRTVSLITVLKAAHLPAVFSPTNNQLLATRSEDRKSVLLWRVERLASNQKQSANGARYDSQGQARSASPLVMARG